MYKTCNKCGCSKPIGDFYPHPQMRDGHLGHCKACHLAHVAKYRAANPEKVRAYDRERSRLPHRKAANAARAALRKRSSRQREPLKRAANIKVGNAIRAGKLKAKPCERCGYGVGVQAHHEDYSKPLDVVWLCKPCHGERHREINEDQRKAKVA